ncbi:MAG: hypothetical protein ACC628_21485 [Pirellulaceae bacterium]
MPATDVFFFQADGGSVPVLDWMNGFRERNERAYRKCFGVIRLTNPEAYGFGLEDKEN